MTLMHPRRETFRLTLLCLFIVSVSIALGAQQRMLWQGAVRPQQINVYTSASLSEPVATTLKRGDVVEVVLEINAMGAGWCRISLSSQSEPLGYVLCLNLERSDVGPNHRGHSDSVVTQSPATSTTPKLTEPTVGNSAVLTNKDILDLNKIGLRPEILVAKIKSSQCNFDTSTASLQALKTAGLGDSVILAMVEAPSGQPRAAVVPDPPDVPNISSDPDPTARTPVPAQQQTPDVSVGNRQQPRVFLQSASHGNTWNARRDQSMEMSKDFERVCPGVRVTINQQMADYTVLLNHIELGLFARDNQMQVADKNGDLLKTNEGGGIKGSVKKVCELILVDWRKQ
jgi:hypothetical protein